MVTNEPNLGEETDSAISTRSAPPLPPGVTLSPGNQSASPESSPTPRTGDQWAVLAGLRFVLAFIVLCGHIYTMYTGGRDWTYFGRWINQEGSVFGFFLISGYSIAASLDRSTKGFYQRRIERIWPLYIACFLCACTVCIATGFQFTTPRGYSLGCPSLPVILGNLLMLQTILVAQFRYIGPAWSLSIEWWMYMVAPILRRTPTWALAALIGASCWRFVTDFHIGIGAMPSLAWFWITGFLYWRHRAHKHAAWLLALPCLLVLHFGARLYLAPIATMIVIAVCRDVRIPFNIYRRALLWLGDVSYPLYLIHIPAVILLSYLHVTSSILMVLAALIAAVALLYGVDYPMRRRAASAKLQTPFGHEVVGNVRLIRATERGVVK